MVRILGNYHAVIDGIDQIITGVHNLPGEIEKELETKGFAEIVEEKKLTGEEKEAVKTFFLVDGKLTGKEQKVEYTLESLNKLTIPQLEALAKEKGIELKGKDKEEKVKEIFEVLGA